MREQMRVRPLTEDELLALSIAAQHSFVRERSPESRSQQAFEELTDAGLMRRARGGYTVTPEGREVARAGFPDFDKEESP